MIKLDDKDVKILCYVDANGSYNLDDISRDLNISRSTVHYRIKRFEEMGIIKRRLVEIDPAALGLEITSITLVYANYEKISAEKLGERLAQIPGVIAVYYVLGDVDFIVLHKAKDREDLKRILKDMSSIEGVVRTGTHFVATTIKEEKRILVNYSEEMLLKLLCSEEKQTDESKGEVPESTAPPER